MPSNEFKFAVARYTSWEQRLLPHQDRGGLSQTLSRISTILAIHPDLHVATIWNPDSAEIDRALLVALRHLTPNSLVVVGEGDIREQVRQAVDKGVCPGWSLYQVPPYDIPLSQIQSKLETGAYNILCREGFRYLHEVEPVPTEALTDFRNMGPKRAAYLRQVIADELSGTPTPREKELLETLMPAQIQLHRSMWDMVERTALNPSVVTELIQLMSQESPPEPQPAVTALLHNHDAVLREYLRTHPARQDCH